MYVHICMHTHAYVGLFHLKNIYKYGKKSKYTVISSKKKEVIKLDKYKIMARMIEKELKYPCFYCGPSGFFK